MLNTHGRIEPTSYIVYSNINPDRVAKSSQAGNYVEVLQVEYDDNVFVIST